MSKLPYIKFFPSDWIADTRSLSLAAKGAWIDIICTLHNSQNRGIVSLPIVAWARTIGSKADQAKEVINELSIMQVCEAVTEDNGNVTLSCRRIQKEERTREQTRQRVEKHRNKASPEHCGDGCDADYNDQCNANVTGYIPYSRSQKPDNPLNPPQAGDKEMGSRSEKRKHRAPAKHELQLRVEKLFQRRESTPWDNSELRAWKDAKSAVEAATEAEWESLAAKKNHEQASLH